MLVRRLIALRAATPRRELGENVRDSLVQLISRRSLFVSIAMRVQAIGAAPPANGAVSLTVLALIFNSLIRNSRRDAGRLAVLRYR